MPFRTHQRSALALILLAGGLAGNSWGQGAFGPQGGEYRIAGELPGEQVNARMALGASGGYVVWQDNYIDGNGVGIGAIRLGSSFNPEFSPVRMNIGVAGNQENPDIALLQDGGSAIVWEGDQAGTKRVFAQFLRPDGTLGFANDLAVSSSQGGMKIQPRVAGLTSGGAVVAWGSFQQDDPANPSPLLARMQGVYARLVANNGTMLTEEFRVNQQVRYNQRNPDVAVLADGRLAFVWVSEEEPGYTQNALGFESVSTPVNIYGRLFNATGSPLGNEFKINSSVTNICAQPSITARDDGGFTVAWSEDDLGDRENSWDIQARAFAGEGSPLGAAFKVNTYLYGDQVSPDIANSGGEELVVWTSLGQDGSREGIFGQSLHQQEKVGGEIGINTTTVSRQILPAVAASGDAGYVTLWSSFVGGDTSVDLYAQRFLLSVPKPAPPIVSAISQNRLSITWAEVEGFEVESYEIVEQGNPTSVLTTNNWWITPANLLPSSERTYRIAYRMSDGRVSPLSDPATGKTWGADDNFDGLPDDWQRMYWASGGLPSPLIDSDGDGATNLAEFLASTSPTDAGDVLHLAMGMNSYGRVVQWNTKAGLIYELQSSSDFKTWQSVGRARFAVSESDGVNVDDSGGLGYYRVVRIR